MTETTINEAALSMAKATRKVNETLVASTLVAQERNIQFGQSILASGVEAARRNAESTIALTQTLVGQAQHPQAAFQAWLDSTGAAQDRALQFAQDLFEQGTTLLKTHTESMQTLTQDLFEQAQQQQAAFRTFGQEALNASMQSFFGANR